MVDLMPHLRDLSITAPEIDVKLSSLPQLESLHLDFSKAQCALGDELIKSTKAVAPHFMLPSLGYLQLHGLTLDQDGLELNQLFPKERYRRSPITTLRVMECSDASLDMLSTILLSINALKRLTLEVYLPDFDSRTLRELTPNTIDEAIRPHLSTLTELIIVGRWTADDLDEMMFFKSSIFETLFAYNKIKRLGIPEPYLAHEDSLTFHEWLPPQIEELQLQYQIGFDATDATDELMHAIKRMERLAENKNVCLPALRRVIWWTLDSEDEAESDEAGMDRLTGIFEDVGVRFDWLSTFEYSSTPFGQSGGRA